MKIDISPINQLMDIEDNLCCLSTEHDKLYAALMALRDFCGIDSVDPENVTAYNNMTINPKQLYGLIEIVFDYATNIGEETAKLYRAVETYRVTEHASKSA